MIKKYEKKFKNPEKVKYRQYVVYLRVLSLVFGARL